MLLLRIFNALLHLYPGEHRGTFGAEMADVVAQRAQDVSERHVFARAGFWLAEYAGLLRSAVLMQSHSGPPSQEKWIWSLEAPLIASALYVLCVGNTHELGVWGFFFPGTYAVAMMFGGAAAWIVGRECRLLGPRRRVWRGLILFGAIAIAVPLMTRSVEDRWMRVVDRQDATIAFDFPGVHVGMADEALEIQRTPGLTFLRQVTRADGRSLTFRHHTDSSAPPYLLLGGIGVACLALASRRRAVL